VSPSGDEKKLLRGITRRTAQKFRGSSRLNASKRKGARGGGGGGRSHNGIKKEKHVDNARLKFLRQGQKGAKIMRCSQKP